MFPFIKLCTWSEKTFWFSVEVRMKWHKICLQLYWSKMKSMFNWAQIRTFIRDYLAVTRVLKCTYFLDSIVFMDSWLVILLQIIFPLLGKQGREGLLQDYLDYYYLEDSTRHLLDKVGGANSMLCTEHAQREATLLQNAVSTLSSLSITIGYNN